MRHGFEQELQIVDPQSGKLVAEQEKLLDFIHKEIESHSFTGVSKEHYRSQIEYRIGIAENPDELETSIKKFRSLIISCADKLNLSVIACGVNPVCSTERSGENFGDHHHIEINSVHEAINFHNLIRCFIPEFIAISANSPIYNGIKSDYQSYRISRSPHVNYASKLGKDDIRELINHSLGKTSKKYKKPRYWDVTPFVQRGIPTVEVRVFDSQFSIEIIISISILLQAMLQKLCSFENFLINKISASHKNWEEELRDNRKNAYTSGMDGLCTLNNRPVLQLSGKITLWDAVSELIKWIENELKIICSSSSYSTDRIKSVLLVENVNSALLDIFKKKGITEYVKMLINFTKGK